MKIGDLNKRLPTSEMCNIGNSHGTDKPQHGYTRVYHELMSSYRDVPVSVFEIGIYTGASIRMWYDFFHKGIICGIDNGRLLPNAGVSLGSMNEDPSEVDLDLLAGNVVAGLEFGWLENDRIKCYIADQRSEEQLYQAFNHFGIDRFDFIIDDGHHYQEHQQKTLAILFPLVKPGGYYIIEDVCDAEDLKGGKFWGQKKEDCSDSTDSVFSKFLETGILESDYMTNDQSAYIVSQIEDWFIFDQSERNGSPILGTSKLIIIKKK